jgi:hypothetical protein
LQRTLEAFITISTLTQLLYLMLLHAGTLSSVFDPGSRNQDDARCCEIRREDIGTSHKQAVPEFPSRDA